MAAIGIPGVRRCGVHLGGLGEPTPSCTCGMDQWGSFASAATPAFNSTDLGPIEASPYLLTRTEVGFNHKKSGRTHFSGSLHKQLDWLKNCLRGLRLQPAVKFDGVPVSHSGNEIADCTISLQFI